MHIEASIPSPTFSQFTIGPVTIHMYAICILTGIVAAVCILTARWKARGGTFDQVLTTTLIAVPSGLVGARLYHVLSLPQAYFPPTGDMSSILKVWEGGMAIFGGVIAGSFATYLYFMHKHYPLAIFADAIAPALLVAQAIGRLGNWFNQELYGWPTTLPWGLELNNAQAIGKDQVCYQGTLCPAGTLFHPTFLYEMIWNLIGAALIITIGSRYAKKLKAGQQFALYMLWYGVGRSWIENMRINYSTVIFGLRTNIWTAILFAIAGLVLFLVLARFGKPTAAYTADLAELSRQETEQYEREEQQRRLRKAQRRSNTTSRNSNTGSNTGSSNSD